jgi:hypothetical protein
VVPGLFHACHPPEMSDFGAPLASLAVEGPALVGPGLFRGYGAGFARPPSARPSGPGARFTYDIWDISGHFGHWGTFRAIRTFRFSTGFPQVFHRLWIRVWISRGFGSGPGVLLNDVDAF